jgi:hypothetical protein
MSVNPKTLPENIVQTFAKIVKAEPFLFREEDVINLWRLISDFPDDVSVIASSVISWCQERPEILEVLEDELSDRGVAENTPAAKPENYKTLLKNKLRDSFPETIQKQSVTTNEQQTNRKLAD